MQILIYNLAYKKITLETSQKIISTIPTLPYLIVNLTKMYRMSLHDHKTRPETTVAKTMLGAYKSQSSSGTIVFHSSNMCNHIMGYLNFISIMCIMPRLDKYSNLCINNDKQLIAIAKQAARIEFECKNLWGLSCDIGHHCYKFESNRTFTQHTRQLFGSFEDFHNNIHDFEPTYESNISTMYNFDEIGKIESARYLWFWFQKVCGFD